MNDTEPDCDHDLTVTSYNQADTTEIHVAAVCIECGDTFTGDAQMKTVGNVSGDSVDNNRDI